MQLSSIGTSKSRRVFLLLTIGFVVIVSFILVVTTTRAELIENTHTTELVSGSSQVWSITDDAQTGLSPVSELTISLYYQPTTSCGTESTLLGKQDSGGTWQYFIKEDNSTCNTLVAGVSDNTATLSYVTGFWAAAGEWQHVTYVYDNTNGSRLWINGALVGTNTATVAINSGTRDFTIGAAQFLSLDRFFDGNIDDVRFWSRALSNQEIQDLDADPCGFNNGGNFEGWWKFDNNGADDSGNGNNLTNNGSATFQSTDKPYVCSGDLAKRKSSDQSVINSTSLQDDSELKLSLVANTTYIITGTIFAESTSATPDINIAFDAVPGSTIDLGFLAGSAGVFRQGGLIENEAESGLIPIVAAEPTVIQINGTIVTGSSSGGLTLQWAQNTSNINPTTIMAGSYLRAEEIQ